MANTGALNAAAGKPGPLGLGDSVPIKGNLRFKAIPSDAKSRTVGVPSREDQIAVTGLSHEIRTPAGDDGIPGAKPTHGVLVITKDVDLASPLLHQAQADGATFTRWTLMCLRMPPTGGQEENHFTIHLTDAKIAWIRMSMPYTRNNANFALPESEEVAFAYKGIAWDWHAKDSGESVAKEPQTAFAAGDWQSKFDSTVKSAIKEHATAQAKALAEAVKVAVKEALAKPAP